MTFRVRSKLHFTPETARLFSKREWQRALKASLVIAGRDFIDHSLPLRFSDYSIKRLGYSAKKLQRAEGESREQKIKRGLAQMRANGQRDRLVNQYCAPWGGWDPTSRQGAPDAVWRRWYQDAVRTGKVQPAKDAAGWKAARQEMRRDVLQQSRLKERLRTYAIDEYADSEASPTPLVESGALEKASRKARPDAKTRGGMAEVAIRIPRPHPTAANVNRTLATHTPEEAERVAEVVGDRMSRFIRGSRAVKGRKPRRKLTWRQNRTISSTINRAAKKSARAGAHKNRPTNAHRART